MPSPVPPSLETPGQREENPWSSRLSLAAWLLPGGGALGGPWLWGDGAPGCLEMSLLMAQGLLSGSSQLTPHLPSPAPGTPHGPPVPLCCPALLPLHPASGMAAPACPEPPDLPLPYQILGDAQLPTPASGIDPTASWARLQS